MRQITAYESDDGTIHRELFDAMAADARHTAKQPDPDQFTLPLDNETLAASFSSVNQEAGR